jgi:hypothetical protein
VSALPTRQRQCKRTVRLLLLLLLLLLLCCFCFCCFCSHFQEDRRVYMDSR